MDRDLALERYLLDIATQAASLPGDRGLGDFAAHRAGAAGVRMPRDFDREMAEEIADALNYGRWNVQAVYDGVLAGDGEALDTYERTMRFLTRLVQAWHELQRESA